ncbi:hypothetical protein E2C01_096809 [Portunus trituberculatus]|uniref:Uncharacterized protein n=1 Tax=Portunus trituberculatus TaxID=210409 RepID=A0A5B7K892_PORTR|nr:hypothetical protein [Portunus trituberculatus]
MHQEHVSCQVYTYNPLITKVTPQEVFATRRSARNKEGLPSAYPPASNTHSKHNCMSLDLTSA